jgi:ABC-type lipoprotein release transport system permease subunit
MFTLDMSKVNRNYELPDAAILIILGAALAPTVIPTRRAARLDPAAVLRDI